MSQIDRLVRRARAAQAQIAALDQAGLDRMVTAVAWACYSPTNAKALADLAVATTGMGNAPDKVVKNQRKTLGALQDLQGAPSTGVISFDPATGITEIAKPVGVVAAICPATNPAATPTNKAMFALKGGNPLILSPSPRAVPTVQLLVEMIHSELARIGVPSDLVQMLPQPITKQVTRELMAKCDLAVVTGSQANVRAAYESGTPAIGVGTGNVPVIIDGDADAADAAAKIRQSKTFDFATSCSSENSLIVLDAIDTKMRVALAAEGGQFLDEQGKAKLQSVMWRDGRLNNDIVAQAPHRIAELAGIDLEPDTQFLIVEETGVGEAFPFSGEKLSVVLTLYRAADINEAISLATNILQWQGAGHSVGIHTQTPAHAELVAHAVDVARVLVNQSHAIAHGGAFNNGLNFTLSMGCGTWAGNSICENLNYRHFLNITRLVVPIPERVPTEDELWGAYLAEYHAGAESQALAAR